MLLPGGSNLLPAGTFNFLNITKVPLNGESVRNRFENPSSKGRPIVPKFLCLAMADSVTQI